MILPHLSISNSVELGRVNSLGKSNTLIVTGANAKGKSTLLRMLAQNIILAQMGLPVPAKSMTLTPLSIYFNLSPRDAPEKNFSLFVNQAKALREKVFGRIAQSPFQLILLDEILGTVAELRTAAEKVFLKKTAMSGALIVVATHNPGTTELEEENSNVFTNVHVNNFHLLPGPERDMNQMISGAAEALLVAGWTQEEVNEFISEAKKEVAQ